MQTVGLDEARSHLSDLIDAAANGEDVFIKRDESTVVQLVPRTQAGRKRVFGSAKGKISMAPDFDEPLGDFENYR